MCWVLLFFYLDGDDGVPGQKVKSEEALSLLGQFTYEF